MYRANHDWKDDGDDSEFLDDAEHRKTDELYEGEEMDATHRDVT